MIIDTLVRDMFRNSKDMQDVQESLSSGKRINKPSDDPLGASQALDYRKTLSGIDQLNRNIAWGKSWLDFTDSGLSQVNDLINRAKEIAISQSSATASQSSRAASAAEVEQVSRQLFQIANTKLSGRYIFAGQRTNQQPFEQDGTYKGDAGEVSIVVGPGLNMTISSDAGKVFKGTGSGEDIFSVLTELKTALENNAPAAVGETLNRLGDAQNVVNSERASVGGRMNRLTIAEENLTDLKLQTEALLSKTEGVDMAAAAVELADRTNLYKASLAVLSSVIQPSLIDFLR